MLTAHQGEYYHHTVQQDSGEQGYAKMYEPLEDGKIYIKIDDDIVFIQV